MTFLREMLEQSGQCPRHPIDFRQEVLCDERPLDEALQATGDG